MTHPFQVQALGVSEWSSRRVGSKKNVDLGLVHRARHEKKRIAVSLIHRDQPFRYRLESWIRASSELSLVSSYSDIRSAARDLQNRTLSVIILDLESVTPTVEESIKTLKSNEPVRRIMVLSDSRDDHLLRLALRTGADGLVGKNASYVFGAAFLSDLLEVCAGGCPLSPQARSLLVRDYQNCQQACGILSPREAQIAGLWGAGLTDKEIAVHLNVSFETIKTHAKNIFAKLQVHNRVAACHRIWTSTRQSNR